MKSVDLSHFDSSSITSVKNMFQDCTSLESINFANFKPNIKNKNNYNNILSGSFENLKFIDVNDATKNFIDAIKQNQIIRKNQIEVCENQQCQREQSYPIIKPEIIPTTQPTILSDTSTSSLPSESTSQISSSEIESDIIITSEIPSSSMPSQSIFTTVG